MHENPANRKLGDEPYYPIDDTGSHDLLTKHQAEAVVSNIVVGGRLGGYKYYDIDKSIYAE